MSLSVVLLLVAACITGMQANVLRFEIPQSPNFTLRSQNIVDFVNNHPGATWKAEVSKRFTDEAFARHQMGLRKLPSWAKMKQVGKPSEEGRDRIPETFDARKQWPHCPTIQEIRDQGDCGSCWAFAAVETFSDRICIHSDGQFKPQLSALDLIACCDNCGFGCHGGFPMTAWRYFHEYGVVTGGGYESKKGCMPYTFPMCEHFASKGHHPSCHGTNFSHDPQCHPECIKEYNYTYLHDKFQGESYYGISQDVWRIQTEIMNNGPLEVGFLVCEDFIHYKSGVYHHLTGYPLGWHAVKVLGWGVENGTPYWLVANSWNTDWGDKGFFKILRGQNECHFEENLWGGVPRKIYGLGRKI